MEVDEDIVIAKDWDVSFVIEFEAVEAILALDSPLLGS